MCEESSGEEAAESAFAIGEVERAAADWALAERFRLKYPDRRVPRWFPREEREMAARCAFTIAGDLVAKKQGMGDALRGAWMVSRGMPPTIKFIFGSPHEHFPDHEERGRKRRRWEAFDAGRRTRDEARATRSAAVAEERRVPIEQVREDMAKLFTWPKT